MTENDLKDELPDVVKTMETRIKAIIQQYNNRMIGDRLTVSY